MSDWEIVKVNENANNNDWELYNPEKNTNNPEKKGWKSLANEAFKSIKEPLSHPIQSLMETLPELASEAYGLGEQALSLPFEAIQGKVPRITKNVYQGIENLLNTPATVMGLFGRHGIGFPEDIEQKARVKINPFEMEEQKRGDALTQSLPSIATLGPLGEAGQLGKIGRAGSRALSGSAIGVSQGQNPITSALLNTIIPAALEKGFTNTAIAKKLSNDKSNAIKEAGLNYNNFFDKAKNMGVAEIERPSINAGNIYKNSSPKFHDAMVRFLNNPTLENAHWAQSDLGFLKRHLLKLEETVGLTSSQQQTLKNAIEAQNRIKANMFKTKNNNSNQNLIDEYNKLSTDYANNVIPLKEIKELSKYENKEMTANNLIKSLLNNDTFKLGVGKKYPQIQINRALRSTPAKLGAGALLSGLGFEEGRKFIK